MKLRIFLLTMNFLAATFYVNAQSEAYTKAMEKAIMAMDISEDMESLQKVANTFERIAGNASDQWLPPYYNAYTHIIMNFQLNDGNEKDQVLDKAQEYLDKAIELGGDASEIYAVQAFLYIGRITAKPMVRGMSYSGKVRAEVEKSLDKNSANPRAYYVLGQLLQGMPSFAGGGMDRACPEFQTAAEKFKSFEPKDSIHPNWGKRDLKRWLSRCEN